MSWTYHLCPGLFSMIVTSLCNHDKFLSFKISFWKIDFYHLYLRLFCGNTNIRSIHVFVLFPPQTLCMVVPLHNNITATEFTYLFTGQKIWYNVCHSFSGWLDDFVLGFDVIVGSDDVRCKFCLFNVSRKLCDICYVIIFLLEEIIHPTTTSRLKL